MIFLIVGIPDFCASHCLFVICTVGLGRVVELGEYTHNPDSPEPSGAQSETVVVVWHS